MKQIVLAAHMFRTAEDEWPNSLEEALPFIGEGGEDVMVNPLTGDNPGYEYVKPINNENLSSKIILYQLSNGVRDDSLPVAYADGTISEAP